MPSPTSDPIAARRTLGVRLDPDDLDRLGAIAQATGLPPSSIARDLLVSALDRGDRPTPPVIAPEPSEDLRAVCDQLSRLGNSANQLARLAHCEVMRNRLRPETARAMADGWSAVLSEVRAIRERLLP